MALPAAILFGGVAAVGVPYALAEAPDPWARWAMAGAVRLPIEQVTLHFSWPVFCIVTLLIWGVLAAARQG